MDETPQPVADAAMDAKMREIWARLEKPWVRTVLRQCLPPTRVRSMGCEFLLHPSDNFTEFRIWEKGLPPEHEATERIAERLAGRDAVIVDVGANAGAFALPILKRAGAGARALLFEPNPVMQVRLAENIRLNGFDNAEVFGCAVGERDATVRLQFPRNGNLGQGRVDLGYDGGAAGVEVRLRPLADCLAEAGAAHIDFLKVDVEGLEDRVICPLLERDDAPKPALIYVEIEHDGAWAFPLRERLAESGYVLAQAFGKNSLFARDPGGAP